MLRQSALGLAVICLSVAVPLGRAADAKDAAPAFTLQIRSLDRVLEDLKYLATLAGKEEEAKQIDGFVKARMGPKGLEGIDTKRPLGMYSVLKRNVNVGLIPIASEEALLGLLESLNIKAAKEGDVYAVTPENLPVPIYLRFANGYAYVTSPSKAALDKDNLLDPATVLPAGDNHLLSAAWQLDEIPDALKQIALQQMRLRFTDEEQKKQPGETAAQRELRVQILRAIAGELTSVVKDGNRVELRLDVDRQKEAVTAEAKFTSKPGSELASEITRLGQGKSVFAGLANRHSAAGLSVHFAVSESIRKALAPAIDEGIRQGVAKEKDDAKRKQAQQFLDALKPTLKSGELDGAFELVGPTADKLYTFLGGFKLREGAAVEEQVRTLVKNLPQREQSIIKLDTESAGSTHIHRVDAQGAFDENARQTFGNNPLFVAIGPDAVWLSAGPNGLDALKNGLSLQPKAGPQFRLGLSMSRLAPAIARGNKDGKQVLAAAEKSFSGSERGKDKVNITVEGGKTLTARFVLDGPVIRFLGAIPKGGSEKPPDEK